VSDRLFIAAKAPRPGLAKTRLARDIGTGPALALYRAFLADLAARFAAARVPMGWYVTPADAWRDLAPIVGPGGPAPLVLAQGRGDWTERQRALFRGAAGRGERRTVLVASDSPQLEVAAVHEALAALERHDVALGPTEDGGYYLIAMRGWHDVLAGVAMGTDRVLDGVLRGAARTGATVALLRPTFDVDRGRDLGRLEELGAGRADLPATAGALAALGRAAA
jgi:rSAM/selenodomain-associated transferase 1